MAINCRECSASNEDFARQCASCGAALPRMCPSCGALNEVEARFCSSCGTRLDDASLSRGGASSERVRGYLPGELRQRFLAAGTEAAGEQRQVTVLFVDLVESTEIIGGLPAEGAPTGGNEVAPEVVPAPEEINPFETPEQRAAREGGR